jgi:hypothetical protein
MNVPYYGRNSYEGTMKPLVIGILLAMSSTAFAQTASLQPFVPPRDQVLVCAQFHNAINIAIARADDELHEHEVGVTADGTLPPQVEFDLRDLIQNSVQVDIERIRIVESSPYTASRAKCEYIAVDAITTINNILTNYGFKPVKGELY